MNIRSFKHEDFKMIESWWIDSGQCPPLSGMMTEDGTFILEINNIPSLSMTVFKTQSSIAYFEGFIKNPNIKKNLHKEGQILWDHCFSYAKKNGYKQVICYCMVDKLKQKYISYGMNESAKNLSAFVKEI